jgi:long-subunit acyl-CoA synthetase (AMP-forming)
MGDEEVSNMSPICIQSMMRDTVRTYPDRTAMRIKRDGKMVSWTFTEYEKEARETAKGFLACGLERQNGVGIMAHNCPEWALSSVGSICAGGLSCGIYMTYSSDMISYMGSHAPLDILVIQDEELLDQV